MVPEPPPVKLTPVKIKSQFPVYDINNVDAIAGGATALDKFKVTVPLPAVTVIKLVAPGTNEVLATVLVQLPLTLPLLKLNDPPAVILVPDVFLSDST